jgi:hypothetical protein
MRPSDLHLQDIEKVLQTEPDVVEYHNTSLLNFTKWIRIKNSTMDALRYRDFTPDYSETDHQVAVTLIKSQLRQIGVDLDYDQFLKEKSETLQEREEVLLGENVLIETGWH